MKAFVKSFFFFLLGVSIVVAFAFTFKDELFLVKNISVVLSVDKVAILPPRIQEDVESKASKMMGRYFWELNISGLLDELLEDSRVKSAHVQRWFPGNVKIVVTPHIPKVLLLRGKESFFPISRDGSLLPKLKTSEIFDGPILRGKEFANNKRLRKKVIDLIEALPKENTLNVNAISEVAWKNKEGLLLYTQVGQTLVRMGKDDFKKKAQRVEKVLSYLQSEGMNGRVIDSRFSKKVVVKLRNEP